MITRLKFEKIIYWTIFIFIVGCFSFIFFCFPKSHDDWWFWGEFLHYGEDPNGHHSLAMGIAESFRYHWNYDNIRLGNIFVAILLHFPRCISSLIVSLCFGIGFFTIVKNSEIGTGQIAKFILLSLLLIFTNPWQEGLFAMDYSFNYVCVWPIFFGALWLFIRLKPTKPIYMLLLGILLGMWHESFAVVVLVGGTILLIFRRLPYTKWRIALLLGIFLGLLWLFLPPAAWNRLEDNHYKFAFSRLIFLSSAILFEAMWLLSLLSKRMRPVALSPLPLINAVTFPILLFIVIKTAYVRAALPSILLSACCIVIFASHLWTRTFRDKTVISWVLSFLGMSILGVHLIAVCLETIKIRRFIDEANHELIMNPKNNAVFIDNARYPWDSSPLTLGRPDINIYRPRTYHFVFLNYFVDNFQQMVVPRQLKNYRKDEGKSLDGGTQCRLWNGFIVSPCLTDTAYQWANVIYGKKKAISPIQSVIFKNDSNQSFVYFVPTRPITSIYAGDPTYIDFAVFDTDL